MNFDEFWQIFDDFWQILMNFEEIWRNLMNFDEIFFHQKLKILAEKTETFFFHFLPLYFRIRLVLIGTQYKMAPRLLTKNFWPDATLATAIDSVRTWVDWTKNYGTIVKSLFLDVVPFAQVFYLHQSPEPIL